MRRPGLARGTGSPGDARRLGRGPVRRRVYVETTVPGCPDALWARTQDPVEHARWDARFTAIASDPADAHAFSYALRLPGVELRGTGTTVAERRGAGGGGTSVLRFRADTGLAPLQAGSGYWRYVPVEGGTRFLTGYDYVPGPRASAPTAGWCARWSAG